jgi:hypothetical protein
MRERIYYFFRQPLVRGDRTRLMRLRDVTPTAVGGGVINWRTVSGTAGVTRQSDNLQMIFVTNQITLGVSMTAAIGLTGTAYVSVNEDRTGVINSIAIPDTPSALISCAPGNWVWFEFNSTFSASSTVTVRQQLVGAETLDTFNVTYT